VQPVDDALALHRERLADGPNIEIAQIRNAIDAHRFEFGVRGSSDPRELADVDLAEPVVILDRVGQIADAVQRRCRLGDVIGELGQRLRGPKAVAGRDPVRE